MADTLERVPHLRVFAYTRVSTLNKSTDMQHAAIEQKYPNAIFGEEKTTGTTRKGRIQLEGIKSAKAAGKHLGRRLSVTDSQREEIKTKREALNPTELAKEYRVSRATIYHVFKQR